MEIIETSIFTRKIRELISDEEYGELQFTLIQRPDVGVVIPQSDGIRKIRWSVSGRGKRGGIRVIYYWYVNEQQIYMLLAYAKNEQANLSAAQLKVLKKLVEEEFGNG